MFKKPRRVQDRYDWIMPQEFNVNTENWRRQLEFLKALSRAVPDIAGYVARLEDIVAEMPTFRGGEQLESEHVNVYVRAWRVMKTIDDVYFGMRGVMPGALLELRRLVDNLLTLESGEVIHADHMNQFIRLWELQEKLNHMMARFLEARVRVTVSDRWGVFWLEGGTGATLLARASTAISDAWRAGKVFFARLLESLQGVATALLEVFRVHRLWDHLEVRDRFRLYRMRLLVATASASITDVASAIRRHVAGLAESISTTVETIISKLVRKSLYDALAIGDYLSKTIYRTLATTVSATISDAWTSIRRLIASITETISASVDVVVNRLVRRGLIDALSTVETFSKRIHRFLSANASVAISDAYAMLVIAYAKLSETISATVDAVISKLVRRIVSDALAVSETFSKRISKSLSVSVSASIGDAWLHSILTWLSLTETVYGSILVNINRYTHSDVAHSDVPHSDVSDYPHSDVSHSDVGHTDAYHSDVEHLDAGHIDAPHSDQAASSWSDHSDTPHGDAPFSDVAFSNVSHSDVAGQAWSDHSDAPHADYPHSDVSHSDVNHSDSGPFTDILALPGHTDIVPLQHSDVAFSNVPHSDEAHVDTGHQDFSDYLDVSHSDVPFSDVTHSDATHYDSGHLDFSDFSDFPHSDVAHGDAIHGDTPHSDAVA